MWVINRNTPIEHFRPVFPQIADLRGKAFHEHRNLSTRLPMDASGCRSMVRRSMLRLVRQPGQYTSAKGMLATNAARRRRFSVMLRVTTTFYNSTHFSWT